jgi:hypothetical protein
LGQFFLNFNLGKLIEDFKKADGTFLTRYYMIINKLNKTTVSYSENVLSRDCS